MYGIIILACELGQFMYIWEEVVYNIYFRMACLFREQGKLITFPGN